MINTLRILSLFLLTLPVSAAFDVDSWYADSTDHFILPRILQTITGVDTTHTTIEDPKADTLSKCESVSDEYKKVLSMYDSALSTYRGILSMHDNALSMYDGILCRHERAWIEYEKALSRYGYS